MPRPGFVLEVDERTPPLLVHEGEGYRLQKFPWGTRVVYPPDALPAIKDVNAAVRYALTNPVGAERWTTSRSRCRRCVRPTSASGSSST
jgi:hypothetical protein